jgi:hypothetical protein
MKLITMVLVLSVVGCASKSTETKTAPSQSTPFDSYDTYKIRTGLDTVRQLQELGETKAIAKLRSWAKAHPGDLRTIIMCRMLFKGRKAPLRRPYLGGAGFFGGTTYADWPLEPITIFEGVPILITRGYTLGGKAESAEAYLTYCIQNGSWVSLKYEERTPQQITASVSAFMAKTPWKQALSETDKTFFWSQAK